MEKTKRIRSFIFGGIAAAVLVVFGIFFTDRSAESLLFWFGAALCAYTLISCLILANNFIGDMILEVFSWGFVRFPGLIFELDLDGIIWLLTVKLAFWIIGLILAVIFGILGVILGLLLSVFVYPFALVKSIREGGAE